MKISQQVYLNCAKHLSAFLPCAAAFFDLQGTALACTDPARSDFAQVVVYQCMREPDQAKKIARSYGAQYATLEDENGQPLCITLLMESFGQDHLMSMVRTLLLLILQEQDLYFQRSLESNDNLSFIREILFSDRVQNGALHELAIKHQYPFSAYRAVMLFDFTDNLERTSLALADKKVLFSRAVTTAPGYHFDDIFDFLNSDQAALLKIVPPEYSDFPEEYLSAFARAVVSSMETLHGIQLHVSVGSCYYELAELCDSYAEARFLTDNFEFFNTGRESILFVTDHISDYLFSLLPKEYYQKKFSQFSAQPNNRTALVETLIALSKHNMSFQAAAKELGLHRNTLLQRYEKLCARTHLDPSKNRRDRVTARQYALFQEQKITIRAGLVIRGDNNIPNILFDKLAERLARNSGGTLRIELHTVGLTGNNPLLLDLLHQGKIDIGFGHAGMAKTLIGDRISVVDAPFLFDSPQQMLHALNGPAGQELLAPLQEKGFLGLAFLSMGWRYFSCDQGLKLRLPQDLSGHSVRIMHMPLLEAFLKYLGAHPYYISYDKLPAAVGDGLIDFQENPYQNFYDMHLYRKHKKILELNMVLDNSIFVTSLDIWNRFNSEQQEILSRSIRETAVWNSEHFYDLTAAAKPQIQEQGVEIQRLSQQEIAQWRRAVEGFLCSSPYQQFYLEFQNKIRDGEEMPEWKI